MEVRGIFGLTVLPGEVALAWINSYSGIMIKTPNTTLIFDPVMINPEVPIHADVIAITHEHSDHFAPELVKDLQEKTSALVLTTPFVAQMLPGLETRILSVGDSFIVGDLEIHAEYCKHPGNQPLSFVISTESGITIYHPSDSESFPEMVRMRETYEPDILLYSGTSLENAAQIASLIKPQVIVSYATDVWLEDRLTTLMARVSPMTSVKMIKRFEVYQYRK